MKVLCTIPDTVKVMGQPSHTEYIFNNENGHIVDIKDEDWDDLSKKTRKSGCCGNRKIIFNVFQKVE